MSDYPIDVHYACLQLGLDDSRQAADTAVILRRAEAYQFIGKERLKAVRRFTGYFTARQQLGALDESFSKLRKNYYKQAMTLHPDRSAGGKADEDRLKRINAAYELVEAVYREAQQYFRQSEAERAAIENAARDAYEREAGRAPNGRAGGAEDVTEAKDEPPKTTSAAAASKRAQSYTARPFPIAPGEVRFCAASVPRYIRNARLPYLGRDAVIGSRMFQTKTGQSLVYDIIMLSEQEFMRAKLYLSLTAGQNSSLELTMSKMTPAYMPMDTKQILVPAGQANPWNFARDHFVQAFGLDKT